MNFEVAVFEAFDDALRRFFRRDEQVLAKEGITDLEKYAVVPGGKLYTDLFVD